MFRRLPDPLTGTTSPSCAFTFDGNEIEAFPDESVASALLRSGVPAFRSHPLDGTPRLPFCMMGVCQECLVKTDGGSVRRACLMPIEHGLNIEPATVLESEE